MKIGIDVTHLDKLNKKRGIGFYTKYLYESLIKFTAHDIDLIENINNYKVKKYDLIHYPFFDLYQHTLPLIKKYPTVVTIHDVVPLVFPTHYPVGIRGKANIILQKYALKNVKSIITVSQTSKNDIEKYLKIESHKIFPIYHAPAKKFVRIKNSKKLEKIKSKFDLPDKFALFVGNVNWNKNVISIIEASINARIDLVLVGSGFNFNQDLNHPELKALKEIKDKYSNNPRLKILGYVNDFELVELLNLAFVFLFPSYYEGFGLPILEAQSCGLPVITSNLSSTKEITGESALLVDPYNIENITEAILKLNDKKLYKQVSNSGLENAKKFSWEKVAMETVRVYEKTLS